MSAQAYVGTTKRTFRYALAHLMETDYGLLGSRRILEMLVEDVQQLVEQFYQPPERLQAGWMVFTGTRANGPKAYPGQTAAQHELMTLAWPVLTQEDVQALAQGPNNKSVRRKWLQQRLVRLVEYGWEHPDGPVLLTLADLAAMTGSDPVIVSQLLQDARDETGKTLMLKGYYFDQGVQPTHKAEVIALYEQGLDETEVARRSQHDQTSVGRYIRDYERVKLLYKRGVLPDQMPRLLGLRPSVVGAYIALVEKYHPELPNMHTVAATS